MRLDPTVGGLSVLHVAPTIGRADGISTATLNMILAFQRAGLRASLLTAELPGTQLHNQVGRLDGANVLKASVPSPIGRYPFGFLRLLAKKAAEVDLVHIHGLWRYPTLVGGPALRRAGVPYVVSPHGLLMPEALGRHNVRKAVAYRFAEGRTLRRAALVIADGVREAEALRVWEPRLECAIVQLAVDTDAFAPGVDDRHGVSGASKHLLTVSRLHPLKRILELVEAFGRVAAVHRDWDLVIAGPEDDAGYRERIEVMASTLGISRRVQLVGRLEGAALVESYRAADVFVLPSTSESSGLSVVEALSIGIPVIATTGTPWAEITAERCGWWIDPGLEAMAAALDLAMKVEPRARQDMGVRARSLALRRYSLESLRGRLVNAYHRALANATSSQPERA
jgi:glycosyltransferase involved in cell wall biosynthesis